MIKTKLVKLQIVFTQIQYINDFPFWLNKPLKLCLYMIINNGAFVLFLTYVCVNHIMLCKFCELMLEYTEMCWHSSTVESSNGPNWITLLPCWNEVHMSLHLCIFLYCSWVCCVWCDWYAHGFFLLILLFVFFWCQIFQKKKLLQLPITHYQGLILNLNVNKT